MFRAAKSALLASVGSLALVPWRQSRALEVMSRLDEVRRQTSLAEADRVELERSIQVLESRARVVPLARTRLGMHTATTAEMVILPGELRP